MEQERGVYRVVAATLGQVAAANGCEQVVTFDKAAAKLPGFGLLGA